MHAVLLDCLWCASLERVDYMVGSANLLFRIKPARVFEPVEQLSPLLTR